MTTPTAPLEADAAAFGRWIADLRHEIGQVYSRFDLVPADWRDDFDNGRTPAEAFDRIMQGVAASKAREARH